MVSPYTGNTYTILSGYDLSHGIDVSKYQTDVDWAAVKADGIDSVMIRCAFRGYGTEGTLVEDSSFTTHIEGALAAGLHVGAYIYSQAITEAEGQEEARKCLDLCSILTDRFSCANL